MLRWVPLSKENFPLTDEDILRIKSNAQNFTRISNKIIIECFYEKLSGCNRAETSNYEIIQRVVNGIGDDWYRYYLVLLSNYQKSVELLSHSVSECDCIENDKDRILRKSN